MQSEDDKIWAAEMELHSLYFVDGPVKGDHQYSDKLHTTIKRFPRGGKSISYYLIADPQQDLLEYRYSIRKPE
jgi:hypothetical protein